MTFAVRLTPRAFDDLLASVRWWSKHRSPEQAVRWYEGIRKKIDSLSSMPESRPLARENARTPFELRELHYGLGKKTTHRVLFRVVGRTVEVLAVCHVAQDELDPNQLVPDALPE